MNHRGTQRRRNMSSKSRTSTTKDIHVTHQTGSTSSLRGGNVRLGVTVSNTDDNEPIATNDHVSTVTTTSSEHHSSGHVSGDRSRHRSSSPLSPHHATRVQEKQYLQNLNDRLAVYIEKVRRLENDNSNLQQIVKKYSEVQDVEIKQIKSMYDGELAEARRTLDELATNRARLEIELGKQKSDADSALNKLAKRERDFRQLENRLKQLEVENGELKSKLDTITFEMNRRGDELQNIRNSIPTLESQLARSRQQLEDETLRRVDLENRNLSLKEELTFKNKVHGQELDQMRSQKRVEIQEADERIKVEYDNKLVNELNRIRADTDAKITEMRQEVEACFERKLKDADDTSKRNDTSIIQLTDDLSLSRSRVSELVSDKNSLQRKCFNLEETIRNLEEKLADQQKKATDGIHIRDAQIDKLREELNNLCNDYQAVMDVKISLDQEISAYRKLLESEEQRLHIDSLHGSSIINVSSVSVDGEPDATLTTGRKRKRDHEETMESSTFCSSTNSKGAVEIIDEDNEAGTYIKLYNNSNMETSMEGWVLERTVTGLNESMKFEFPRRTCLSSSSYCCVWSAGSAMDGGSDPTHNFKLSLDKTWPVGNRVVTYLYDQDGMEVSMRESQRTIGHSSLSRSSISRAGITTRSMTAHASHPSSGVTKRLFGGFFG